MKKLNLIIIKKIAIYARKYLDLMMTMKNIIKQEITANIHENIELLLMIIAIGFVKHPKNSNSIS